MVCSSPSGSTIRSRRSSAKRLTGDGLEDDRGHLVVEVAVQVVGARREVTAVCLGCRHEQAVGDDDVLAGEVAGDEIVGLGDLCGVGEQRDVVEDVEVVGLVVDAGRVAEQHPHGDRRVAGQQAGNEIVDAVVERQLAALDGVEHQGGGDRLGDAGDAEPGVGPDRAAAEVRGAGPSSDPVAVDVDEGEPAGRRILPQLGGEDPFDVTGHRRHRTRRR